MDVVVRRAVATDIAGLIGLMQDHALYERSDFDATGLDSRLALAMQGETPRLFIFVVELDGKLQGYCSLALEFSSWQATEYLHLDCLFVSAELRGRRIGEALFRQAVNHAKQLNVLELQWQTPAWNAEAIRFYQRLLAKGETSCAGAELGTQTAKQRFQYKIIE